MNLIGESIYGAGTATMAKHGTGYYSQPGMMTANTSNCTAYYHILRYGDGSGHRVNFDARAVSATLLADGRKVAFRQSGRMLYFSDLPKAPPTPAPRFR